MATTPPARFYPLLLTFHLFPLHAPLTLWLLDAPFGKFAWGESRLNLPGNVAWAAMEIVAPLTFTTTLSATLHTSALGAWQVLPPRARVLAGLYLAHYAHRAVISPLFLAPKRAPLHAVVVASAAAFNLLNASLLAMAIAAFPPPGGWSFYVGVAMWVVGFAGNVYHDEILHDLRRPPSARLVSRDMAPTTQKYSVPHGGLFALVSAPNYLCEWLEWIGFALAAAPYPFIPVPPLSELAAHLPPLLASYARALAPLWPRTLLAAPWAFVAAEITSMLPRAIRSHKWYTRTFEDYPEERRAVVPWLL